MKDYGEPDRKFIESIVRENEQLRQRLSEADERNTLRKRLEEAEAKLNLYQGRTIAWIPKAERLPEKDGRYLVWLNSAPLFSTPLDLWYFYKDQNDFRSALWDEQVTHWAYLPEGPGE